MSPTVSAEEPGTPRPAPEGSWADVDDEGAEPPFKTLTREEARALMARSAAVSPWRVVAVQAAAGGIVAVLAWLLMGELSYFWSALYGAAAVVLPQALLARGMSHLPTTSVSAAALRFVMWEVIKIAVAVAMLAAARHVVHDLSWPALLVALVVGLKASWLVLLKRRRLG